MTCRTPSSSTTCSGTQTGQQLSYDAMRRLATWQNVPGTSPSQKDTSVYDGEGQRIQQIVTNSGTTTTTNYIQGIEEIATTGSTTTTTKYYTAGLVQAVSVNGSVTYLVPDALGSISEDLDASGNVLAEQLFGPYGNVRYSVGSMPGSHGYTGQVQDASGLSYFNARYYDPVVGQFTSADTVQGPNRYDYVAGDPETLTDPTGKIICCGGYTPPLPVTTKCNNTDHCSPHGPKTGDIVQDDNKTKQQEHNPLLNQQLSNDSFCFQMPNDPYCKNLAQLDSQITTGQNTLTILTDIANLVIDVWAIISAPDMALKIAAIVLTIADGFNLFQDAANIGGWHIPSWIALIITGLRIILGIAKFLAGLIFVIDPLGWVDNAVKDALKGVGVGLIATGPLDIWKGVLYQEINKRNCILSKFHESYDKNTGICN